MKQFGWEVISTKSIPQPLRAPSASTQVSSTASTYAERFRDVLDNQIDEIHAKMSIDCDGGISLAERNNQLRESLRELNSDLSIRLEKLPKNKLLLARQMQSQRSNQQNSRKIKNQIVSSSTSALDSEISTADGLLMNSNNNLDSADDLESVKLSIEEAQLKLLESEFKNNNDIFQQQATELEQLEAKLTSISPNYHFELEQEITQLTESLRLATKSAKLMHVQNQLDAKNILLGSSNVTTNIGAVVSQPVSAKKLMLDYVGMQTSNKRLRELIAKKQSTIDTYVNQIQRVQADYEKSCTLEEGCYEFDVEYARNTHLLGRITTSISRARSLQLTIDALKQKCERENTKRIALRQEFVETLSAIDGKVQLIEVEIRKSNEEFESRQANHEGKSIAHEMGIEEEIEEEDKGQSEIIENTQLYLQQQQQKAEIRRSVESREFKVKVSPVIIQSTTSDDSKSRTEMTNRSKTNLSSNRDYHPSHKSSSLSGSISIPKSNPVLKQNSSSDNLLSGVTAASAQVFSEKQRIKKNKKINIDGHSLLNENNNNNNISLRSNSGGRSGSGMNAITSMKSSRQLNESNSIRQSRISMIMNDSSFLKQPNSVHASSLLQPLQISKQQALSSQQSQIKLNRSTNITAGDAKNGVSRLSIDLSKGISGNSSNVNNVPPTSCTIRESLNQFLEFKESSCRTDSLLSKKGRVSLSRITQGIHQQSNLQAILTSSQQQLQSQSSHRSTAVKGANSNWFNSHVQSSISSQHAPQLQLQLQPLQRESTQSDRPSHKLSQYIIRNHFEDTEQQQLHLNSNTYLEDDDGPLVPAATVSKKKTKPVSILSTSKLSSEINAQLSRTHAGGVQLEPLEQESSKVFAGNADQLGEVSQRVQSKMSRKEAQQQQQQRPDSNERIRDNYIVQSAKYAEKLRIPSSASSFSTTSQLVKNDNKIRNQTIIPNSSLTAESTQRLNRITNLSTL